MINSKIRNEDSGQPVSCFELQILKRIGRHFSLQIDSASRCGGGFSGASVFRAEADSGRSLAVRRISRSSSTSDEVAALIQRMQSMRMLLTDVFRQGVIEVPVPLVPASELIGEEDLWQIEPWMPGTPICTPGDLTSSHLQHVVQLLHRFHSAAANFAARSSSNECFQLWYAPSPAIRKRLHLVSVLLDSGISRLVTAVRSDPDTDIRGPVEQLLTILRRRLPNLQTALRDLADFSLPLQPVIRDLRAPHVLFTGDRVSGLIDLYAADTDHVATDLTRLGRSWFGADNSEICSLIRRYMAIRRMDSDELRLVRVLDECSVLLSPMHWVSRRYPPAAATAELNSEERQRVLELISVARRFRPLQFS